MSFSIPVPQAREDKVDQADWIELEAVQSNDGASSFVEFTRQIRISGSTDAMITNEDEPDPSDAGGEQSEEVATDAWNEIERRHKACGGDDGTYPFEVSARSIVLKDGWENSPYIFQLLLKQFGLRAGPKNSYPERLFEDLSVQAATQYLGGTDNEARGYGFGFPRPDGSGFVKALNSLCRELNSGSVRLNDPKINQQKDSHLDVVAWRPFVDMRSSQLILFGQCGVGDDWDNSKLTELQPDNFQNKWLGERFYPNPVRIFFVPRCIEERDWRTVSIDGGIIFDRCRITDLVGDNDSDSKYSEARRDWSSHVAERLREAT